MSLVAGLLTCALIFSFGIFVQGNQPYVDVNVTCHTNGSVTIVVWNLTDLVAWGSHQGRWNLSSNPECPPTEFDIGNRQVIYENFDASLCKTNVYEIGDDIVYEFTINAEVDGDAATRTYRHEYNVMCRYNADGTVDSSFVPLHEVSDSDEDTENLTLSLTLSPDTTDIALGNSITATVTVDHPLGEELDISLVQCTVTSAVNSTGYELIAGSCPEDPLNFITSYNCTAQTSNTEVFIFEAFRFASQPADQVVLITCDVYVCLASNSTSSCITTCNDCDDQVDLGRRRRDVDKIFRVQSNPFYVVDHVVKDSDIKEQEEEHVTDSSTNTGLIIGVCVGGIAAVAIVCVAVIILTRRRTQSLPVSDTSSPGSYVNQGI